jgi:hypothetical protein
MTFFDASRAETTVIAHDGRHRTGDGRRVSTWAAETCDVIVAPDDSAYTIFARAMDRSLRRGTLATRAGAEADLPLDPPVVTMADMMGDMGGIADGSRVDAGEGRRGGAAPTCPA